jgi:CheY-like chemotaxis protein
MSVMQESPNTSSSPRIDIAPRRVLIADDDPAIRRLFAALARRAQIECDTAANGADAVAAFRQRAYSLLFLDIMMPRIDGRGVLDYLRAHMRDRLPAVFVITALLDQPLSAADREIVRGVLCKPVDADDIAALPRGGSPAGVLHRTRHRLIERQTTGYR